MKKLLTIVAIVSFVAFLVSFFNKIINKDAKNPKLAQSEKGPASAADVDPQILPDPAPNSMSPDVGAKDQKIAGIMRQIGLKRLPFAKKNGFWEVKVRFKSTVKKCEAGDLDLIRIDQKRRSPNSLALSLEDMGKRKNLIFQKIDVTNITNSAFILRWKAETTQTAEPRSLGLYLCSNSRGSNSCSTAAVTDINQVLKNPEPGSDRVYYFQYIQEGEQLALLDTSRSEARNAKGLNQVLSQQSVSAKEAAEVSEKISQSNLLIGSMAALVNETGLTIDLPRNDPACPLPHLQF